MKMSNLKFNKILEAENKAYLIKLLPWVIISFGIALCLRQYFFNRALWSDEASLALSIINNSFSGLLNPIKVSPISSPLGFLAIERLFVYIFGDSEYALRLFPLLCAIISPFVFYKVARYYLRNSAVIMAISLFALSGWLIYYSAELKQYSCDVTITLLLYLVTIYVHSKKLNIPRIILFGFIGAVSLWFSYISIFILLGIGLGSYLYYFKEKDKGDIIRFTVAVLLWLFSFIVLYFTYLNRLSVNPELLGFWKKTFMPFPPSSLNDIKWLIDHFLGLFNNPVGFHVNGLAVFTFLIGCVKFYKDRKEDFVILISVLILPLIASVFHKYPFYERLLLFIVPSVLIFISEGAYQIITRIKPEAKTIKAIFLCLLFLYPSGHAVAVLKHPHTREEIKPVLNYVRNNWENGDVIYLHHGSKYIFDYYAPRYGFNNGDYILGICSFNDYNNYIDDINKLQGRRRVWVIISHHDFPNEVSFILSYLDKIGIRKDFFNAPGAVVYFYNLSK